MTDPRWEMIELLRDTGAAFADRVEGLEEAQWLAAPAPGAWNPAAIAEHVTLVEVSTGKLIARKLFAEPASEGDLASARQMEARLLARETLAGTALGDLITQVEHAKASIRAKVEHPFHVVKNLFKHRKTRYKGLAKNTAQLMTLFGLANLVLARRWLLAADSQVAS